MPTGYFQIKGEKSLRDEAEELAKSLSSRGAVRFTAAQVLSAGLVLGVRAIKADPSVMLPPAARPKKSS